MSNRTYVPAAEIAKLIRQSLKEAAPGVKFSVRSERSGSINIGWCDGPSAALVDGLVKKFAGAYFDGMIDYQGTNYLELDGKPIYSGASFIFTERKFSDAAVAKAIVKVARKFSAYRDIPTIEQYRNGDCLNIPLAGVGGFSSEWNWSTQIWRVMAKASDRLALAPSKTADRLKFQGDDGYGQGTVGMPGDRMTGKGYPQTVGA